MPIADKGGNLPHILVTGGAGFIGSALVSRLLREGYTVAVFDNLSTGKKESLIGGSAKDDKLDFVELDLADSSPHTKNKLIQAINQCDIVFHLAANADVKIGHINTNIDFSNNIIATRNLLECIRRGIGGSRKRRKKIIFTSSSTVYGEALTYLTSENYAPLKPISLHGASKLACEALISGYIGSFSGLTGVIFRLANVVGPTARRGVVFDIFKKLRY
jgi:UDP-glucose 4-epimerase